MPPDAAGTGLGWRRKPPFSPQYYCDRTPQRRFGPAMKMNLRLIRKLPIRTQVTGWSPSGDKGRRRVNDKQKTASAEAANVPKIDASTLLASGREVILIHKDSQYRLRLTSNDKLILTK